MKRNWWSYAIGFGALAALAADSSQYSSLKQINAGNVKQLQVAWTYSTGERGNYSFDPIVVDGVMYVLAKNNSFIALDAGTGKELWAHPNMGAVGTRGANYWESKDRSDRRLLYINAGYLTAIDARSAKTIESFGDNGRTDLRTGLDREAPRALQTSNPGRIFENLIIILYPLVAQATTPTPQTSTPTMFALGNWSGSSTPFRILARLGLTLGYRTRGKLSAESTVGVRDCR